MDLKAGGMQAPQTAILYQNEAKTVTLIDLPTSITLAQSLGNEEPTRTLLSCAPLQEPYASTEPKTESARANVLLRNGSSSSDDDYKDFITAGLEEIRKEHLGKWCLPRELSPIIVARRSKKRKLEEVKSWNNAIEEPVLSVTYPFHKTPETRRVIDLGSNHPDIDLLSLHDRLVHNSLLASFPLRVGVEGPKYIVPAGASFLLSNIDQKTSHAWAETIQRFRSTPTMTAGQGQFDVLLLDPPWTNRSVSRSKKYETPRNGDPMNVLQEILGQHMAPGAFVGCWTTNKSSVRKTAIEAFHAWDVKLVEEWVWVKVTASGEPVYDIGGIWRKPYEVLLVGRKEESFGELREQSPNNNRDTIPRKLVVGVPDLHSRKPCLKELVEAEIARNHGYRALEIFARNLTAGWTAWGNEVLKFNWEGHWTASNPDYE